MENVRSLASLVVAVALAGCFNLDRSWDGGAASDQGDGPLLDRQPGLEGPLDGPRPELTPDVGPPDLLPGDTTVDQPGPVPTWVTIPAGTFKMGSPAVEKCREPIVQDSETQHDVTLTHDFEIMTAEVTQDEILPTVGTNPSAHTGCPTCPAESVTWKEAAYHCNELSKQSGDTPCYGCTKNPGNGKIDCWVDSAYQGAKIYTCPGYRLPTDAEWEYAYRAGSSTSLYNGVLVGCVGVDLTAGAIGWYKANSGATPETHPGRMKQPNAWGLYDMAGNVQEWCHDGWEADLGGGAKTNPVTPFNDNDRVVRGGSYNHEPQRLRAADREGVDHDARDARIGLRCVRTLNHP